MRRRLMQKDIPKVDFNGYDFVDMGEAGYWATCNIGASKPEDIGDRFAWGEIEPKKSFSWSNYKFGGNNSGGQSKYLPDIDGLLDLLPEDDAAHIIMGGDWRMPTDTEMDTLSSSCIISVNTWVNNNRESAIIELFSKENSNKLIIPLAVPYLWDSGFYHCLQTSSANHYGSTMNNLASLAQEFNEFGVADIEAFTIANDFRYLGYPVRGFIPKQ